MPQRRGPPAARPAGRRPPSAVAPRAGALAVGALGGALTLGPAALAAQAGAAACATVPLRVALEQVAAGARLRLSYSRELIPITRPVCPPAAGTAPLVAIGELLRGTGVEVVPVGGDQLVLAPAAHDRDTSDLGLTIGGRRAQVLDRVLVTGNPAGAPARSLPVALDVVDGEQLGARAGTPLSTALDGAVPGLWIWSQPTTTLLARYAGLRGASSFGLTTPKLYLDGVEVANPLLVTQLAPDRIERVEVIRGPQGAALYGADAISGVINVVTRHDGAPEGSTRALTVRTGVGAASTAYATGAAVAQDYAVAFRAGSGPHTGGLALGVTSLGPVVSGRASRQVSASGDARRVGGAGVLTLSARYTDAVASPSTNPIVTTGYQTGYQNGYAADVTGGGAAAAGPARSAAADSATAVALAAPLPTQRARELTLAATGTRLTGVWTQTATAGLDAYRLSGVSTIGPGGVALASPLDSAQAAARGGAARVTLRGSTAATFALRDGLRATVTGIADYGLLRDATAVDTTRSYGRGGAPAPNTLGAGGLTNLVPTPVLWLGTAGLVGQTTLAWRDELFVTAGLRAERNDGFTDASRAALLPSLGISEVRTAGATTVKLRTAYGRGLRPARTAARAAMWRAIGGGVLPTDLAPESQSGIEGGVDLYQAAGAGQPALALHLTAFDQRASGLIQQVAYVPGYGPDDDDDRRHGGLSNDAPPADTMMRRGARRFGYSLENIGAIGNRGVEASASARAATAASGAFTLGGSLTYVSSRVRRTATGYTGELRAGDRMLEVPRWTMGATAEWRQAVGWSAAFGASRAYDWINYDRVALAQAVGSGTSNAALVGAGLRRFLRRYDGETRVRAELGRDVARGLAVVFTGENLLNYQRGEPDDVTLLPGRTLTAGLRARF